MTILEYFDADNLEHLRAFRELSVSGTWPREFIAGWPEDLEFPVAWQASLAFLLAERYAAQRLRELAGAEKADKLLETEEQRATPELDNSSDGVLLGEGDGKTDKVHEQARRGKEKAKAVEATAEGSLVDNLQGIILEAMGFGSLCWEPRPTGVFNSEQAIEYCEKVMAVIKANYRPASPAVEELVRELKVLRNKLHARGGLDALVDSVTELLAKYDNAKGGK